MRSFTLVLLAVALAIIPGALSAIRIGATGCSVDLLEKKGNFECMLTVPGGQLSLGGSPTITTGASGGETATIAYDSSGRVVGTDVAGRMTSYAYDAGGRLSAMVDSSGETTSYAYDFLGRMVAAGDSRFTYSDSGLTRAALDEGDVVEYAYDSVSNVISFNQGDGSGRFTYARHGRVTGIDTTAETIEYEYDGKELVRSVADGEQTDYSYDHRRRLVRSAGRGGVVDYEYDRDGSLLRITGPGGVTRFTYGRGGHLISISGADGGTTAFAYDAAGLPTSVRPEVGDEVLVLFEHGGLNAPVAVGYLWTENRGPAVSLTSRGHLLTCSTCP